MMMLRRFLSFVSLQQRPSASHAQLEMWSTTAEIKRKEAFNASLLEYWQRFADEEKAQWEGENRRSDTFNRMVVGLDDAFKVITKDQEKSFQDEEVFRSDSFQKSEDLRDRRFSEGESNRALLFLKDQEARKEQAEWYAKLRESCCQRGRQEREEIYQKLEKDMQEQADRLLGWEEEQFTSAEKQRDAVVLKIVTEGNISHKSRSEDFNYRHASADDNSNLNHPYPSPIDASVRTATGVHFPPSSASSADFIPSPQESSSPHPVRSDHPMLQSSVEDPSSGLSTQQDQLTFLNDIIISNNSSKSSSTTDQEQQQHASLEEEKHNQPSVQEVPSSTPKIQLTSLDSDNINPGESRFRANQERRQRDFLEEEEQRTRRFSKAEYMRDQAETVRNQTFQQREATRDQRFWAMMVMHRDRFEGCEASRCWKEDWRNQEHGAAENSQSLSFDQTLLLIERQYSASNALEVEVEQSMQRKLQRLERMHRVWFGTARQRRSATFTQAQVRREVELSVPTLERPGEYREETQTPSRSYSDTESETGSPQHRPFHSPDLPSPSRDNRHYAFSPAPSLRRPRPSPTIGLHPLVLFNETMLREPLPVPGTNNDTTVSSNDTRHPQRRQVIFSKSQTERDEMFEDGLQTRRRAFNANETQRELDFQQLQMNRMESAIKKEQERTKMFRAAQGVQHTSFLHAEKQREMDFRDAEQFRAQSYRDRETDRNTRFYSKQGQLLHECFSRDRQRTLAAERWASIMLRDAEERETGDYHAEEREREKRFAWAIKTGERAVEAHSTVTI